MLVHLHVTAAFCAKLCMQVRMSDLQRYMQIFLLLLPVGHLA